jgi:hypothetical protein
MSESVAGLVLVIVAITECLPIASQSPPVAAGTS